MRIDVAEYGVLRNVSAEFKPGLNVVVGGNGSGKSSLLEAILWCVYGESRVRLTTADTEVTMLDHTFRRQTDERRTEARVERGDEAVAGVRNVSSYIDDSPLLPDKRLMLLTSWCKQGELGLISLSATERRQFLGDLLDLSRWDTLRARAKLREKVAGSAREQAVGALASSRERLASLRAATEKMRPDARLAQTQPEPTPVSDHSEEIARLESLAEEVIKLKERIAADQAKLEAFDAQRTRNVQRIESELDDARTALQGLMKRRVELNSARQELERARKGQETLDTVPCKSTDFPKTCRFVKSAHAAAQGMEKLAKVVESEASAIEAEYQVAKMEFDKLSKRRDQAQDEIDESSRMFAEIIKQEDRVERAQPELARLGRLQEEQKGNTDKIALRERWLESKKALDAIATYEGLISETEGKIAELEAAVEEKRHTAEAMTKIAGDFGPKGVPGFLIETALPELAQRTNEYLALLHDDLSLAFSATKEKVTGGSAETLDILVSSSRAERVVEACSGGEKTVIDVALRLALRDFAEARGKRVPPFMVLDETLAALDEGNRTWMLQALLSIENLDMLILVSHVSELRDVPAHVIDMERWRVAAAA